MHQSQQIPFFNNTRDDFTHGHYQMANTEIKLITFFITEDGEAEQDLALTMAQIISFS